MGRFKLIYKQYISGGILKIIRDKEAKVQYLVSSWARSKRYDAVAW